MRNEASNRPTVPIGLPSTSDKIGGLNVLSFLTVIPIAAIGLFVALLIFFPDFYITLGEGDVATHHALYILLLGGMAVFALAIELDVRLARKLGPLADDARTSLAISTCLAVILFAVWIGVAAEKAKVQAMETVVFVWMPVMAVSVPLLWFTARTLARGIHRAMLLAGFVAATAAVEWGFTAQAAGFESWSFE